MQHTNTLGQTPYDVAIEQNLTEIAGFMSRYAAKSNITLVSTAVPRPRSAGSTRHHVPWGVLTNRAALADLQVALSGKPVSAASPADASDDRVDGGGRSNDLFAKLHIAAPEATHTSADAAGTAGAEPLSAGEIAELAFLTVSHDSGDGEGGVMAVDGPQLVVADVAADGFLEDVLHPADSLERAEVAAKKTQQQLHQQQRGRFLHALDGAIGSPRVSTPAVAAGSHSTATTASVAGSAGVASSAASAFGGSGSATRSAPLPHSSTAIHSPQASTRSGVPRAPSPVTASAATAPARPAPVEKTPVYQARPAPTSLPGDPDFDVGGVLTAPINSPMTPLRGGSRPSSGTTHSQPSPAAARAPTAPAAVVAVAPAAVVGGPVRGELRRSSSPTTTTHTLTPSRLRSSPTSGRQQMPALEPFPGGSGAIIRNSTGSNVSTASSGSILAASRGGSGRLPSMPGVTVATAEALAMQHSRLQQASARADAAESEAARRSLEQQQKQAVSAAKEAQVQRAEQHERDVGTQERLRVRITDQQRLQGQLRQVRDDAATSRLGASLRSPPKFVPSARPTDAHSAAAQFMDSEPVDTVDVSPPPPAPEAEQEPPSWEPQPLDDVFFSSGARPGDMRRVQELVRASAIPVMFAGSSPEANDDVPYEEPVEVNDTAFEQAPIDDSASGGRVSGRSSPGASTPRQSVGDWGLLAAAPAAPAVSVVPAQTVQQRSSRTSPVTERTSPGGSPRSGYNPAAARAASAVLNDPMISLSGGGPLPHMSARHSPPRSVPLRGSSTALGAAPPAAGGTTPLQAAKRRLEELMQRGRMEMAEATRRGHGGDSSQVRCWFCFLVYDECVLLAVAYWYWYAVGGAREQ